MNDQSLRARKKAKTRQALAENALRLFADRGFEATTIDEIAAAAEVSRRTFFRYFDSKEQVVFDPQDDRIKMFQSMLVAEPGETGFQTVWRALFSMADVFINHREQAMMMHHIIQASPHLLARDHQLYKHWEDAAADALLRDVTGREEQVQARCIAAALVAAVRMMLREWLCDGATADLKQQGERLLRRFADGFPLRA